MSNSNIDPSWYRNLKGIGCGTTAGFVVTMAGHPFDTLKVRLQTQSSISPIYFGTADCIRKTIKWEGMRGLYKGVASPMAGQVLFRTSLFTTYYEALHYFAGQSPKNRLETKHYFLAGGITGFVAAFTDAPIELV
uniref:Mitochondrial substrate carrier family protein G (Trinotate prediction) n=1 Tax=Myxobolus squamalis TaxID=59785 RepID=A0A6B2G7V1_MYXSQ